MNHVLPILVAAALVALMSACGVQTKRGPELKAGSEQALDVQTASRKAEADDKTGVIYATSGKTGFGGDELDPKDKPDPEPVAVEESAAPVKIELTGEGELKLEGAKTELEKLKPVFEKAAADTAPVVVIAPKDASMDQLSTLFAAAFEAGVATITVQRQVGATQPVAPAEPTKK